MEVKLSIKGRARQVFEIIKELAVLHPKTTIAELP
jgi:hypothetical protein